MICRKIFQIDISKSLTADLCEDHELNITDNSTECFDPVTSDLTEKCEIEDYKPASTNNEDVKSPEDFRTLSIYATSNDILHPGMM